MWTVFPTAMRTLQALQTRANGDLFCYHAPMYTAIYKKTKSGYIAWIEEIPGVNTQGRTKKSATSNLRDALREFVAARRMLTKREYPKEILVREPLSMREVVHA